MTDRAGLQRALLAAGQAFGVPTVLINNAALDSPPSAPPEENGPFETYPEESWDNVIDVNLKGVYLCCQVFGAAMARAGRGSIVNVSSISTAWSRPTSPSTTTAANGARRSIKPVAYSASKSAC